MKYARTYFQKADQPVIDQLRKEGKYVYQTQESSDGRNFVKQCFWSNNNYIQKQIRDII